MRSAEDKRIEAIKGFLAAGMHDVPSTAVAVDALGNARRAVKECLARGQAVEEWLAGEVRLRGVRENVAVLAVLELSEYRTAVATSYRKEHPERAEALDALIAAIE